MQLISASTSSMINVLRKLKLRWPSTGLKSLASELQHSNNAPIHPLWAFLPEESCTPQALHRLRRRRLWAWLKQKRQRIAVLVLLYLLIWSIPLLFGEGLLTVFAILPLVLVPPVGYLVYWLVWKEFHA